MIQALEGIVQFCKIVPVAGFGMPAEYLEFAGQIAQIDNFFDGFIAEIIVILDYDLANFQRCEGYLSWRWSNNGDYLPVGHPYKDAAPTV